MMLRQLPAGRRFKRNGFIYVSRGSGFYASERGYDGGPWHNPDLEVEEAACQCRPRGRLIKTRSGCWVCTVCHLVPRC